MRKANAVRSALAARVISNKAVGLRLCRRMFSRQYDRCSSPRAGAQLEEQIPNEVEGRTTERECVGGWVVVLPRALEHLQLGEDVPELLGFRKVSPQNSVSVWDVRDCTTTEIILRRWLFDVVHAVDLDFDDPPAGGFDGNRNFPESR